MEICCTICNGHYRKGMEVCPVCGIAPIQKDEPGGKGMCNQCYLALHPEIRKEREERKARWDESSRLYNKGQATKRRVIKRDFPCTFRGIEQKCRCKPGTICGYSKTKAKNCPDYKEKKGVKK
jgi:hypothetical protein